MANTTSQSYTFDKTLPIEEIVEEAYERIGIQNVSGYQLKTAKRSLNILFSEWGNRGLHYWEIANNNITLVDSQAVYTMYRSTGDGTSDATAVYGVDNVAISRSQYQGFSNKTAKGIPTQYFVERFIDKTTITLYLTPGAAQDGNKINYYYVKRIQDVGAYTNATDVPFRFVPCMCAGLSYYLSQKNAPQRTQELKLLYEDELARAVKEDADITSTYIAPKVYFPNA